MSKRTLASVKVGVLICLVIIGALVLYAHMLKRELNNDVKNTLKEVAEQSVKTIYNEVDSEYNLIRAMAHHLTSYGEFDIERNVNTIKEITGSYPFKRMGIIMPDGSAYTTDDIKMNLKDREYYESVFQGETVLSDRLSDKAGGAGITVYATPIYENDKVAAVLFATYSIESFRNLMSVNTFDGEGYSYIVNQNGNTVVDSSHPTSFKGMKNIFEAMMMADPENSECSRELKSSMNNGDSGYIIFSNKVDKYLYYTPLGVNDWYLMNVVPTSVAQRSVRIVMNVTYILCVIVAGMSVLFMLYLARSNKKKREMFDRILYVDQLTGGMSYTKFSIEAKLSLMKNDKNAAYAVFDLDNFKLIGEVYGNDRGDEILRYVYRIIEKCASSDSLYARRTADRFVLLLYYDTREELNERLLNLCRTLQKEQPDMEGGYIIKPSIGVYLIENHNEDIQRMQNLASIARASIKHKYDEFISYYKDIYRDTMLYNKKLENQMEIADKNHEFVPFFQPKYNTITQKITGAEALIRWIKPDGTVVSPSVFIPLAESNSFVVKLDRQMFEMVCSRQKQLIDEGYKPVPISVNLSRQVLYDKTFIDIYEEIMKKYGVTTDLVELEITESALFENQDEFKSIIDELHKRGFKILMDDFGVGYSSMMMLKSIHIDKMKLDKSFVDDYNDKRGSKIIVSVIELARSLNIPVTAEGVETGEQYEFFKKLNCDSIQGYYFAKPMPFEEYRDRLSEFKI